MCINIDGVVFKLPEGAFPVHVDNPQICCGCDYFNTEKEECNRPAKCEKSTPDMRQRVEKYYTNEMVENFLPDEDVRNFLWRMCRRGVKIIYITDRPMSLGEITANCLIYHNFPFSSVILSGHMEKIAKDSSDRKIILLGKTLAGAPVDFVMALEDDPETMKKYKEKFDAVDMLSVVRKMKGNII